MAATDKNMDFDVNLLPTTNSDHNLGSISLKWNLFTNKINGIIPTLTDINVTQSGNAEDKDYPILLKNTNNTTDETASIKYSNNITDNVSTSKPFTYNPSTGILFVPKIQISIKDNNFGFLPYENNCNSLGTSNLFWYRSYVTNYYGTTSHITNWDSDKNIGTAASSSEASVKGLVNFYNECAAGSVQTKTALQASANSNITLTLPNTTGTLALTSSNITGNAANVTGTVAIANGGTGATNAEDARTNLKLGNVENTALSTWEGSSNITTLGTLNGLIKIIGNITEPRVEFFNRDYTSDYNIIKPGKVATISFTGPAKNVQTSEMYGGYFSFCQNSYNDNGEILNTYERYSFPTVIKNLNENSDYVILTSKRTVTIAQGGTGATTAADARTNLEVPYIGGDTFTGNVAIQKNGDTNLQVINSNTNVAISLDSDSMGKHGIFSYGYLQDSNFITDTKWMIYRNNNDGEIIVNGNAYGLRYQEILNTDEKIDNFLEGNHFKIACWNNTNSPGVSNGVILSGAWGTDNYGFQLAIDDDASYYIALRQKGGNSGWLNWKQIPMGDGTGASGTWPISITGNAATATTSSSCTGNAATATTASSCSGNAATATSTPKLSLASTNTQSTSTNTYASGAFNIRWFSNTGKLPGQPSQYGYLMTIANGDGSAENHQIWCTQANGSLLHRGTNGSSYQSPPEFMTILDSSNYTSYCPTKTGSGASGTWEINITGNSNNATYLANRGGSTVSIGDSSWAIQITPSGHTNRATVFSQKWTQSGLTYTPSGGSATTNTDTADIKYWLSSSNTSNSLQVNMQIDGRIYALGGFQGNLTGNCSGSSGSCTGNAATATKATQDGSGNTITSKYLTIDTAQTITGTKSWGTNGAGGQLNGAATNGGINSIRVGDDVWLGDCNAAGIMGMKSTSTKCGLYMYNSNGTEIGELYFDGTNLVCNKNINANILGNAATATAAQNTTFAVKAPHPWPAFELGTNSATNNEYTSPGNATWVTLYATCPVLRKSDNYRYSVNFFVREYSHNGSGTRLNYYEDYYLPACNTSRTNTATYNILTTKSVVTVPQGGTGAANAAGARANLGITSQSGVSCSLNDNRNCDLGNSYAITSRTVIAVGCTSTTAAVVPYISGSHWWIAVRKLSDFTPISATSVTVTITYIQL